MPALGCLIGVLKFLILNCGWLKILLSNQSSVYTNLCTVLPLLKSILDLPLFINMPLSIMYGLRNYFFCPKNAFTLFHIAMNTLYSNILTSNYYHIIQNLSYYFCSPLVFLVTPVNIFGNSDNIYMLQDDIFVNISFKTHQAIFLVIHIIITFLSNF